MSVAPARRRPSQRPLERWRAAAAPSGAARRLEALGLIGALALCAVMSTWALSRNGWANNFYSAGVKSMLHSLHNFLYVSSDPSGLISIDKPPLALWLQVASAKIFGFTPLSLLLPEAIAGVLSVFVLFLAVRRSFGGLAAVIAAFSLAVFPGFVAVSRDNNPDALLILLMCISCLIALRAIESGRLRTILACGVMVGLAFNVKTLAAYLIVPGIAAGYLACAPGSLKTRTWKLLVAGVAMALVSLCWLTFVDLTPARQRPYVGGSKHNSELGLTFEYNGLGRIDGQLGGPHSEPKQPGAYVPLSVRAAPLPITSSDAGGPASAAGAAAGGSKRVPTISEPPLSPLKAKPSATLPDGRARTPTAFGEAPGLTRLLEKGLGGQGGWLLPLALLGALAAAAAIALRAGGARQSGERRSAPDAQIRRDPRLGALLVLGGWFFTEAVVLSFAKGIVHPYYTSALGPGTAAMAGAGVVSLAALARRRGAWLALVAIALACTVYAQVTILQRSHYMGWFVPLLIAGSALCLLVALLPRSRASWALAAAAVLLLIAPGAWSAATWGVPVQGTFPVAGPFGAPGYGGLDMPGERLIAERHLLTYLSHHRTGSRFSVLTVSSVASSPLILMGSKAASLGGYSGDDPAVSAKRFAGMVSRREARYVLLGGPYAPRGGNGALRATLAACRLLPVDLWGGVRTSKYSMMLFDCWGRAKQIEAVGRREAAHPNGLADAPS